MSSVALSTGIRSLDRLISGLQPSKLFVVASYAGVGKTALATSLVEHVGMACREPVAVFSMGLSAAQFTQRLLCSFGRVNLGKVRDASLTKMDFTGMTAAATRLAESRVFMDDDRSHSIHGIRVKARRLRTFYGVKLIVIDSAQVLYLAARQLGLGSAGRTDPGNAAVMSGMVAISLGLKSMARELGVPVVVTVGVNAMERALGRDGQCQPRLGELQAHGGLVEFADAVALLGRPELYVEDEFERAMLDGEALLSVTTRNVSDARTVKLTFIPACARFSENGKAVRR